MASLMPCNGPKVCPCPVGRCAPRGVANGVHTSSQFAGLRNQDQWTQQACVPSPARPIRAHTQLSETPTSGQRPCAQSLAPWPHWKQSHGRLGTLKGRAQHGARTRRLQVCVATPLLAAPAAWPSPSHQHQDATSSRCLGTRVSTQPWFPY